MLPQYRLAFPVQLIGGGGCGGGPNADFIKSLYEIHWK